MAKGKEKENMTDIDFKRLSALAIAVALIGKTATPVRDAVDMAQELFDRLEATE